MLVLTRKTEEQISIGDDVTIVILSIRGNRVQLGIRAPMTSTIVRVPGSPLALEKSQLPQTSGIVPCLR